MTMTPRRILVHCRFWCVGLSWIAVASATAQMPTKKLAGADQSVYCVRFAPDGKLMATAGRDRTVRMFKVGADQPLLVSRSHEDWVLSLDFQPKTSLIASAVADGLVEVW